VTDLQAFVQILVASGVGVLGTTLFKGADYNLPALGGMVNVVQTGGRPPLHTHNGGEVRFPSYQLISRHAVYDTALTKLLQARAALIRKNYIVDDKFFLWIVPANEPVDLPPDANKRPRVSLNVTTAVREAA
jgi:hypothetical protein